jgi:hypothetical protein
VLVGGVKICSRLGRRKKGMMRKQRRMRRDEKTGKERRKWGDMNMAGKRL